MRAVHDEACGVVAATVTIEWYEGPRAALADLFALADDSPAAVGAPLAMQLRVARHTERLDEVVAYGVVLAVAGTHASLEFAAGGGHGAAHPHPESLLVLYVAPANLYWSEHGTTFRDPAGFQVVLVHGRSEP